MEEDISRCFNFSRALRQYSVHSLPPSRHSCGWGSRLLDRWFSSSCTFGDGWSAAVRQRVGRHFCPIPRNLAIVKSLLVKHASFPPSQFLDLILSFPLLEDLSVTDCSYLPLPVKLSGGSGGPSTFTQPSSLSAFTGTLELCMGGGTKPIAHRLLSLSGGIHFQKLTLESFHVEDIPLLIALVEKCSHTVESLEITSNNSCGMSVASAFAQK